MQQVSIRQQSYPLFTNHEVKCTRNVYLFMNYSFTLVWCLRTIYYWLLLLSIRLVSTSMFKFREFCKDCHEQYASGESRENSGLGW